MPEYRRFIAYFYEYIDGKKQRNTGFAKVELRNGMWRILFRLNVGNVPEPPIRVYGFAREGEYLLGLPMGVMRPGREISEEWAYRAEMPVGKETYRLEDLSGIRIQSGDGRCFMTVWDDEGIDPDRFVLELPEQMAQTEPDDAAKAPAAGDEAETPAGLEEEPGQPAAGTMAGTEPSAGSEERPEQSAVGTVDEVQTSADSNEKPGLSGVDPMAGSAVKTSENASEMYVRLAADWEDDLPPSPRGPVIIHAQSADQGAARKDHRSARADCMRDLLKRRERFEPFQDDEIVNCVQIMPCDIVKLQQEQWQVGRSSFLQHGYYQYRHLLLGMMRGGRYILGVPGMRNPQEKYMAEMFGFPHFKTSKICSCGRAFGYWYRELKE